MTLTGLHTPLGMGAPLLYEVSTMLNVYIVTEHFKDRLSGLGYPDDLLVEWSLGYCQGDGMAFYGRISLDDAESLMMRLLSPERKGIKPVDRFKNLLAQKHIKPMLRVMEEYGGFDLEIGKNSYGHHYSHFNTMSLYDNSESIVDVFEDEDVGRLVDFDEDNETVMRIWSEIWDRFYRELEEDIVSTSKTLESEGYALIEAMTTEEEVFWEFNAGAYTARLTSVSSYFDMGSWDDEARAATIQDFIEGTECVRALRAEILHRETEEVLGADELHGIVCEVHDGTYGGFKRELMSTAINEARNYLSQLEEKAA